MNPMLAHWLRPDAPVYERPLALAAVENSGTE
jgi:hypothetical protein